MNILCNNRPCSCRDGHKMAQKHHRRPVSGALPHMIHFFIFFLTHLPTWTQQLHVNSIKKKNSQCRKHLGRQRETLTFTDGVRILPRLVLLAVILAAPHYVCAAMEDRRQWDIYSTDMVLILKKEGKGEKNTLV